MIQSMTGFGRGQSSNEKYRIYIEIKSVNHRYCDISVHLPHKLSFYEVMARSLIKKYVNRGKIDIFITFEDMSDDAVSISFNEALAASYLEGIRSFAKKFDLKEHVDAYHLSRLPDVVTETESELDEDMLVTLLESALSMAGDSFVASRRTEGERLADDIISKLDDIKDLVDKIDERYPQILSAHRERIMSKVHELFEDRKIDENVLATEMVVYADKMCVDEEMVRLKTHVMGMKDIIDAALKSDKNEGEGIGRKLDFMTQELNREANTILSKSTDITIADYGIELKTNIEKIREQTQNIE